MAAGHCGSRNKLLSSFSSSEPYHVLLPVLKLLCKVDLGLYDSTVTMYPSGTKRALTGQVIILFIRV